ncbi:hypothetical protein AVEN_28289-1 [Araneus ventricosus]|uniref:Uncharacterized protein n=1 Tax=Araneus ventricosus TaxID=182803 RepID=A0A4Y2VFF4_ARAVE|nr:hypothetical protein AVEN_28289-1 [Araneus ventricosus]
MKTQNDTSATADQGPVASSGYQDRHAITMLGHLSHYLNDPTTRPHRHDLKTPIRPSLPVDPATIFQVTSPANIIKDAIIKSHSSIIK